MPDRPLVLVLQPHLARLIQPLSDRCEALAGWLPEGRARIAEARALVAAGEFAVPATLLDEAAALGLIACFTAGYDGVDVAAAERRGLVVTHAVAVNHEDVADHAIGLILAARREIVEGDRQLRASRWRPGAKLLTPSLGGARLGIVGLGAIGAAVARRAEAMRMRVAWWGPNPRPDARWPRAETLVALAAASDVLVVAARATADNQGLVSRAVIEALGPRGLLVNVARGQLVDEDALIAALTDGRLGAAALDVFATEPTPAARWADVPNTVLTPHTAGATHEAVAEMTRQLLANLDAFFAGTQPPGRVRA